MNTIFLTNCMTQPFLPHTTASCQILNREIPCPMLLSSFKGTAAPCLWIPNASYTLIYNLKQRYLLDLPSSEQVRELTFEKDCPYFGVTFLPGILPADALKSDPSLPSLLSVQPTFTDQISCFVDTLNPDQHLHFPNHTIQYMITAIAASNNFPSIQQLAHDLSYSERHISRLFQSHMNYPPKTFIRILRFQRSLQEILKMPDRNNSEFIKLLTYSDQAHFQREFKHFTTMTPRRFIQLLSHVEDY